MEKLILIQNHGDEFEGSTEYTPVLYESKQKFLDDLRSVLAEAKKIDEENQRNQDAFYSVIKKHSSERQSAGFSGELSEKKQAKYESFERRLNERYPFPPQPKTIAPPTFCGVPISRCQFIRPKRDDDYPVVDDESESFEVLTLDEWFKDSMQASVSPA